MIHTKSILHRNLLTFQMV